MKRTIFGVHITQRTESVPHVQMVLTKYGCNIRTRVGLHEADTTSCSANGLVLIEAFGEEVEDFYLELKALKGVEVQRMDFEE